MRECALHGRSITELKTPIKPHNIKTGTKKNSGEPKPGFRVSAARTKPYELIPRTSTAYLLKQNVTRRTACTPWHIYILPQCLDETISVFRVSTMFAFSAKDADGSVLQLANSAKIRLWCLTANYLHTRVFLAKVYSTDTLTYIPGACTALSSSKRTRSQRVTLSHRPS